MRRVGSYSQADFASMRMADQLQAMALDYINDVYFAEEDITFANLTPAKFQAELDKARDGGPVAMQEFNRQLAKILGEVLPQALASVQQQSNGGS